MALTASEIALAKSGILNLLHTQVADLDDVRALLFKKEATYVKVLADATAATVTAITPCYRFPTAYKITAINILPATTAAADATNYATILFATEDGAAGTPVPVGNRTTATVALTETTTAAVTLSGTVTGAAGDILTVQITKAGTGVAIPACTFQVDYEVM